MCWKGAPSTSRLDTPYMLRHLHPGLPTLGPQLWNQQSVGDGLLCHLGQALHRVYADLQMTLSCPSSSLLLSFPSVLNILRLEAVPSFHGFLSLWPPFCALASPCYVVLLACSPPAIPPTPRPEPQGLQCWPCWAGPQGCRLPLRLGQIWVGGTREGEPWMGGEEGEPG